MATLADAAESVSFQWHEASFPPDKNVKSADTSEISAVQFSGSIAIFAAFAAFAAYFAEKGEFGAFISRGNRGRAVDCQCKLGRHRA